MKVLIKKINMQKINFLDLELQQNKIKNILDANLKKVLNHSNYIMGPEVKQLEKALEVYTDSKYCISCASGTDALILSLLAYGIGKGHSRYLSQVLLFQLLLKLY